MKAHGWRFDRGELAGAVGDLGIMLPIAIALVVKNGMNPTAVFLCAGLLYLAVGLYFRLPVAVQPLKAAAAVALATGAGPGVIAAAGIIMGAILLALSATNLADRLGRVFTPPIIRGIQLGVGLLMVKSGWGMVTAKEYLPAGQPIHLTAGSLSIPAGMALGALAGLMLLLLLPNRRLPAGLAVLALGVAAGLPAASHGAFDGLALGPAWPVPAWPGRADFATAFFLLVLPQVPLTFGNAVVCCAATARRYFGPGAWRVTPRALSTSLGLTNLLGGLFGAMPLCHGSGGMTAHYRFGARTGGAPVIIGALLVAAGLLMGRAAPQVLGLIPQAVLGVLLIYVGIEHAMLLGDVASDREAFFTAVLIGGVAVATGRVDVAFLLGMAVRPLVQWAGSCGEARVRAGVEAATVPRRASD